MKTVIGIVLLCAVGINGLDSSGITLSGNNPVLFFNQPDHPFKVYLDDNTLYLGKCLEYEENENVYLNMKTIRGKSSLEIDENLGFDGIKQ